MKNIAGMERRTKIVCTIGPATSSRVQLRALLERVILRERFWSFTLVVGIGFLLLVSLAVGAWLPALGGFFAHLLPVPAVVLEAVNFVILFCVITSLFGMISKLLPDVYVAWRDVRLGAALTSLLFTLVIPTPRSPLFRAEFTKVWGAGGAQAPCRPRRRWR